MEDLITRTDEEIRLGFVATSIETLSRKLNQPYQLVFDAMKRSGAISNFLLKHYDALHTQSREYVDESILEYMKNRGVEI